MPKVKKKRTRFHDLAPRPSSHHPQGDEDEEENLTPPRGRYLAASSQPSAAAAAAAAAAPTELNGPPIVGDVVERTAPAPRLSRGQRKRQKKKEKWLQKFDFAEFIRQQKETEHEFGAADGGPLGTMGDLEADLAEIERRAEEAPEDSKKRSRRKGARQKDWQAMVEQEIRHYERVRSFPPFQADPYGALEQHIKNTLKRQKQEEEKRERERAARRQAKLQRRGEGQGRMEGVEMEGVEKDRVRKEGGKQDKHQKMREKMRQKRKNRKGKMDVDS
ncbi:unnamed protein product [Vitrella brassicaformis CCMP3155]|uniref:Uncharacterized protein n=1 Tax=Vitrella brassicaformis (strain CCMP3155) TaxID=1169540 RepID=A0A0G4G0P4_VITBC|nr:unnamed protein product [Vitrella brassicaformis CCMP3155]|eukprot:CEM21643.1 unnamed protein product [Vitrella brassicaformis CCMP3155]